MRLTTRLYDGVEYLQDTGGGGGEEKKGMGVERSRELSSEVQGGAEKRVSIAFLRNDRFSLPRLVVARILVIVRNNHSVLSLPLEELISKRNHGEKNNCD